MHPQNVFGECLLLFLLATILIVRERGSAISSTNYDALLSGILYVLAIVRFLEYVSAARDSHIMARGVVWFMWLIPVVILAWLIYHYNRIDLIVMLIITFCLLIGTTLSLMSGAGEYDLITPGMNVGASHGVFSWVRTDRAPLFLSFGFYLALVVSLIYLVSLRAWDRGFWILAGLVIAGFVIGAILIPDVRQNPLATLGSLSTLVMMTVAFITILMVPG